MEIKEIQDLIKFVAKSGVSEVQLESKGFKIVIKTNANDVVRHEQTFIAAPLQVAAPSPQVIPAVEATKQAEVLVAKALEKPAVDATNYITIKSPMIGTFYRTPGQDKPSFVNVGEEIKPGKVLCIIEAMKLFNEIECEYSGTIVKILADDGTPVEYDQPLFLIQPK